MSARHLLSQSISFIDETLMALISGEQTSSSFCRGSFNSPVASISSSPRTRLEDIASRRTPYGWFPQWAMYIALSPPCSTLYSPSFSRAFLTSGALGLCAIFGFQSFKRSRRLRPYLRCIGSAYRGVFHTLLRRLRRPGCLALGFSAQLLQHRGRRL